MNRLKWFTLEEFASPDDLTSGSMMEEEFLERLDLARDIAGFPFIINSGFRSIAHNKALKEKGYKVAKNSSHLLGWAADLHCGSGKRRFLMIEALLDAGFTRLGISGKGNFIHVDCDPEKPQMTIWTY
jgi:zinc D-Ala-D-Ala carboxypeptidase